MKSNSISLRDWIGFLLFSGPCKDSLLGGLVVSWGTLGKNSSAQNHIQINVVEELSMEAIGILAGMVTMKFWSESPTINKWLESKLDRFLGHDFLDGPRQRRAFWADSARFVDTGWNRLS